MITTLSDATVASLLSAMPDVPAGHTNAIVGGVDEHGAQVLAAMKLGEDDRWIINAAARYDWSTQTTAVGGSVIYSWKPK